VPPPDPALEARLARILEGPAGPGIGAFFDFDGTLIDGVPARQPPRARRVSRAPENPR
jgi:hypothetical protein